MMRASGLLFLGKTAPITASVDGEFALTLLALDRIDTHKVEPWRITWCGLEAHAFWLSFSSQFTPGRPIRVWLTEVRTFTNGHNGTPEFHASVEDLTLAPLAPERHIHTHHETQPGAPA